jgi:hypothetical protein
MKEIYYIPGENELIPAGAIPLINAVSGITGIGVGEQMLHVLVEDDFDTAGTMIWETGKDEALAPDSSSLHRFAGWRS